MPNAHSCFDDDICASINIAQFTLCSVFHAHSSVLNMICASIGRAYLSGLLSWRLCPLRRRLRSLPFRSCFDFCNFDRYIVASCSR
jgi:hypothetical protein